jgi:hypothetical protein
MSKRSYYNLARQPQAIKRRLVLIVLGLFALIATCPQCAIAGNAPPWVHAVATVPLPDHDERTDAFLLYSERNVTVLSAEKIKIQTRKVYKILRPNGRDEGTVVVYFSSPGQKVTSLHGWSIPAQGKDYEVKESDSIEVSPPKIDGSELVTDVRAKVLAIPASDPGNIVGYEYEVEVNPLVLQDTWEFQGPAPARESHYSLQLPSGWEYKASWLNSAESKPVQNGSTGWQWVVRDVSGIRREEDMPPMEGVAGHMMVAFFPPGGASLRNEFSNWREMGTWYSNLTNGRLDASPAIKQEVAALTGSLPSPLAKMRAIANFVQHDIRYVAIELGIGGFQPHPASDVFIHHYGDCKDKATLMSSMLREVGIDSYYVVINSERGAVSPRTPAYGGGFNHVIVAIKLPGELSDPSLIATLQHPKLGKLLFFDPTNHLMPFGQIGGYLQANYGLLVTPDGGELIELPEEPAALNGIERTASLHLDASGRLQGDVREMRLGDRASAARWTLHAITNDRDRIKPIEKTLAGSLATFHITKATIINLNLTNQPFGFDYSFDADNYAQSAGDLLLVRLRAIGVKSSALLETKDPRMFPIEFEGPSRDTDTFEITVPPGYIVDDLPPAVDANYSFATYHAKSEVTGNIIRYSRTFEVKELSVPVSKADELKQLYRIIATDERNTAVLKPAAK